MTSPMTDLVFAIDLGATKTAAMLYDASRGAAIARDRVPTNVTVSPKEWLDSLPRLLDGLLREAGRARRELCAVGLAVPGQVDDSGNLIFAGKFQGWKDVPLRALVERKFGVPAYVEQDANAAARGEHWKGCATRMKNFVFVALGTGVGAGVVVDGRLVRGAHHAAGELGDALPSDEALRAEAPAESNLGSRVGGPQIREEAEAIAGEAIGAGEAIERAAQDERLEPLAERVAGEIGVVVVAVVTLLDPEAVVLGGGTATEELAERLRVHVERSTHRPTPILLSALGEDAQLYGAVAGARATARAESGRPSRTEKA